MHILCKVTDNKVSKTSAFDGGFNLAKSRTLKSSNGLPIQAGNLAVGGIVYTVLDIILIKNGSYPGYHLHWQGWAPCVAADDGPIVGVWEKMPFKGQGKIVVGISVVVDEVELGMTDLSGGHQGDFHSLGVGAGFCTMAEQFDIQQVNTIVLSGNNSKKSDRSRNNSSKKPYKATPESDFFIYDRKTKFNKNSVPAIEGFDSNEGDRIRFIGKAENKVPFFDDLEFVSVNTREQLKRASQSNFDFVYHQSQGYLYHNQNLEENGFGKGGLMAELLGSPALDESSFGATS